MTCNFQPSIFKLQPSNGQFENETASCVIVDIECEVATKVACMALGQWQAETKPLGEVVDLGEELEHEVAISFRNSLTRILDDEAD